MRTELLQMERMDSGKLPQEAAEAARMQEDIRRRMRREEKKRWLSAAGSDSNPNATDA